MIAAIKERLDDLKSRSSPDKVSTWYIVVDHGRPVGWVGASGREAEASSVYTMQVEVDLEDDQIGYHGYPDDRNLKEGMSDKKPGF